VFYGFDPLKVARMSAMAKARARENKAIIRNRLKIEATVKNARAFLRLQEAKGSFDAFIWGFTDGRTIHNAWKAMDQIPAFTPLSDKVSRALKAEGFSFVGTTICYSLLQAAGVVNDHLFHCYRYKELL
jgi:DNA-3-methyladenine glycosylase I